MVRTKQIIILTSFLFSSLAFGSAKVCKNGDDLIVRAELKFYGKENKLGPKCAQEIFDMFNAPNAKIQIGDKTYNVKFQISHQEIDEKEAFGSSSINRRIENNYIRIEDKAYNEKNGRSNNEIYQNCGFYSSADGLGSSTTCTHEFAHGLGLLHYNDRPENKNKPMKGADLRGLGQPGIMAARGFIVDQEYQWNKSAQAGAAGGTINPALRKVNTQDILDLHLEKLNYDMSGCADLGRRTNTVYKGDGSMEWQGWSTTVDGLKYLMSGTTGTVPTQCRAQ
jgi:hypothetical protein